MTAHLAPFLRHFDQFLRTEHHEMGNCYVNAACFVLDKGSFEGSTVFLCHGTIWGEGVGWHGHAWVEWGDGVPMVVDPSTGKEEPLVSIAPEYYRLSKAKDVTYYSIDEVRQKMLETNTYGPWEATMYATKRTEKEINDTIEETFENLETGRSKWPGMSYEEGVRAALDWVLGNVDENPMEE